MCIKPFLTAISLASFPAALLAGNSRPNIVLILAMTWAGEMSDIMEA